MFVLMCVAQNGPLKGKGEILQKSFGFKSFNQIRLFDLDGNISIRSGEEYSVKVEIDENLAPLLSVEEIDGQLSIGINSNKNNRRYLEKTNIKVTITLPNLTAVSHVGNTSLNITNLNAKSFKLIQEGNGSTTIEGSVEDLSVEKEGNGGLMASKLTALNAKIKGEGNGNITVNISDFLQAILEGNGSISNLGSALYSRNSKVTGNGSLLYK